jgi:hypothetical protein
VLSPFPANVLVKRRIGSAETPVTSKRPNHPLPSGIFAADALVKSSRVKVIKTPPLVGAVEPFSMRNFDRPGDITVAMVNLVLAMQLTPHSRNSVLHIVEAAPSQMRTGLSPISPYRPCLSGTW